MVETITHAPPHCPWRERERDTHRHMTKHNKTQLQTQISTSNWVLLYSPNHCQRLLVFSFRSCPVPFLLPSPPSVCFLVHSPLSHAFCSPPPRPSRVHPLLTPPAYFLRLLPSVIRPLYTSSVYCPPSVPPRRAPPMPMALCFDFPVIPELS